MDESNFVIVKNLATGDERVYFRATILPQEAVVCAFYQAQGNHNWWEYDWDSVQYGLSGRTAVCGDWAVML